MQASPFFGQLRRFAPALTFFLCLLLCARLVSLRAAHPISFDGDESVHAMWGAVVYTDLAHGDLPAFARHLYAQTRFPPLYSLLQLPFLAGMGITPLAHRLTATLWLFLFLVVMYVCVVSVAPVSRRGVAPSRTGETSVPPGGSWAGWPGACLAVLLAAACPTLLAVATTVYLEPACLALMMLTLALYLRARRGRTPYPLSLQEKGETEGEVPVSGVRGGAVWPAALCYALLWFLKWQFGLLVAIVLVAHVLIVNGFRWSRLRQDRVAGWTLLPAWGAVLAWMANPYQLREFLMYLTGVPKPSGLYARFFEGYVMQGRFLVTVWSAGLPAALLTAGGLVYGLSRLRRPEPLLYTLTALAAMVTSANVRGGAEPRIWLWILPPLWVLVGMGVNEGLARLATGSPEIVDRGSWIVDRGEQTLCPRIKRERGEARGERGGAPLPTSHEPRTTSHDLGVSALALGLLLLAAGNVAPALQQARAAISRPYMPGMWQTLDWVTTHLAPDRRLVMVDCWGRGFPPGAVRWAYLQRYGRRGLSFDDLHLWEWPGLPQAPHPLHWRWPWRVRLPAGPPLPPSSDAARLEAARIDALLVCTRPGKAPSVESGDLLRAAAGLGFRAVGNGPGPAPGLRVTAYLRPPAQASGSPTRSGGE